MLSNLIAFNIHLIINIISTLNSNRKLLEIVNNLNMTGHFYWIASDSWGTKRESINSNDLAAEGAITFSPKSYEVKRKQPFDFNHLIFD